MSDFPSRLKARRQQLGLSQAKLASKLGLTQGAIAQLELGRNQSTMKMVELSTALRVTPEWLMYGTGISPLDETASPVEEIFFVGFPDLPFQFSLSFLDKITDNKKNLMPFRQPDDSMSPTINPSDYVLYNKQDKAVNENAVFLIKRNNKSMIRRIIFDPSGSILYRCDNLDRIKYPDNHNLPDDEILGRIVWSAGYQQFLS